jgi:uncharacterized protein DUF6311
VSTPRLDSTAGRPRPAPAGLDAGRADGIAGLALVLALALVWVLWLLPPGFVRGVSSYWQTDVTDATQYLSGFNVFASEPWAWPLLKIRSLNVPDGTLATFVDVIPLYAFGLKLLVPRDRLPFNPFGLWIALDYLLMAAGAWWALREARLARYGVLVVFTSFVLLTPALNGRVLLGHVSLTSHWMILFALALYLRSGRSGRLAAGPWAALLFGAFYVNVYIFVMTGLVFVADAARFVSSRSGRRTLGHLLLPPALILASLPLTMLPLSHVPARPEEGFGFYAMNLLSPFVDGGRLTSWMTSRLWFVQGHYEGYNYLGVGLMLLIGVAIALRLRHDRAFFGRHWSLLAACALATVYAASNRVYVGHRLVLEWPIPASLEWLTGTFRASGRMFWPVGYALVCFAVVTSARWLPPRRLALVLALALGLQWLDLEPIRGIVRTGLARPAERLVDGALWDGALGPGVRTIYLYPKFGCGRGPNQVKGVLAVQRYAAERRLSLSTAYIARYHPPCDAGPREIAATDPASSVYVFLRGEAVTASPSDYFPAGTRLQCRELDVAVACRWLREPHLGRS